MTEPRVDLPAEGTFLLRVWRENVGPAICHLRDGVLVDITSREAATMRDILEADDPVGLARAASGEAIGSPEEIAATSSEAAGPEATRLLAPCDLQAVKACGVTFANSMLERVIEEKAAGDPSRPRPSANAVPRSSATACAGSRRDRNAPWRSSAP